MQLAQTNLTFNRQVKRGPGFQTKRLSKADLQLSWLKNPRGAEGIFRRSDHQGY